MRKLITALTFTLVTLGAWALPDRTFEMGLDVQAGFGNNYFSVGDFLQETLVIDLNDMADTFNDEGLALSTDVKVKNLFNLNLSPDFRLGFFFQTKASGYSNVPKAFFDLAANGNKLDKTYSGPMKLRGDVISELGATFGTWIYGFDTKFGASLFFPLVHLEKPEAKYTFRTGSDGKVTASVVADLPVYSVAPLEDGVNTSDILANLLSAGGFDISVGAEYPLFPDLLIVGADFQNIPILPARMVERTRFLSTMTFTADNIAANYDSDDLTQTDQESSFESDKAPISVLRPFKFNTHAVYTPMGTPLFKLIPNLGLGVYSWVYPEFGLKAQFDFWKWLVIDVGTSYEDELWKQAMGINLNLWLMELDLALAGQSQDIAHSLGSGVGLSVGLKFGF